MVLEKKSDMPAIQCILFDCDGVLVDTETIMISVLLEMAAPVGVQMDLADAVKAFSGRQILETINFLREKAQAPFPADFETVFRQKAYERFKAEVKPIAGAKELITSLAIPYCVASSGPREKIELNLALAGLLPFFSKDRIFSSYEIHSWKPDPGIFLHAADTMGYKPNQCVVIEDSVAGIEAGVRGGFRVYGLTNGYNQAELRAKGAVVFEHMSELPYLLDL